MMGQALSEAQARRRATAVSQGLQAAERRAQARRATQAEARAADTARLAATRQAERAAGDALGLVRGVRERGIWVHGGSRLGERRPVLLAARRGGGVT